MDQELLLVLSVWMLVLICFINIMYLRYSFTKLAANSENLQAIKIHKRKWSFILFTDLIVYIVILSLLLIANVSSKATLISLFITIIYIEFIKRRMLKSGTDISGSSMKNDEYKNDNETININTDEQLINSVGMRRLTINRIKAHYARLLKINIFIETDDISDDSLKLTMNGDQYKQIGSLAYGKSITADVPNRSVKMLVCTFVLFTSRRLPINIKRFTIPSGNEDIVLNIKPVSPDPAGVKSGVLFLIQQETK